MHCLLLQVEEVVCWVGYGPVCFADLDDWVQDGHVPEQRIKLRHGDTLIINTMEGNTMINYFKRFLAVGFQVGLHEYDPGFGPVPVTCGRIGSGVIGWSTKALDTC